MPVYNSSFYHKDNFHQISIFSYGKKLVKFSMPILQQLKISERQFSQKLNFTLWTTGIKTRLTKDSLLFILTQAWLHKIIETLPYF